MAPIVPTPCPQWRKDSVADSDTLPDAVKRLVQAHVPTPAHLEALVVIAREPERRGLASEVAGSTALAVAPIATALQDLAGRGVVQEHSTGDETRYQAYGEDAEQLKLLQDLVTAFDRVPVQLIRAVYARPSDSVQSFADAFRIQRPK